jgi:hypothetical protein
MTDAARQTGGTVYDCLDCCAALFLSGVLQRRISLLPSSPALPVVTIGFCERVFS